MDEINLDGIDIFKDLFQSFDINHGFQVAGGGTRKIISLEHKSQMAK